MSPLNNAPPPRRARQVILKSDAEVVRGASAEALALPAGEFLDSVSWEGLAPDPDSLPAAAFLGWL